MNITPGITANRTTKTRISTVAIATATIVTAALLMPVATASAAPVLCGAVITEPGTTITLTEDLTCDRLGITVRADNVTIDLAGYTMSGHPISGSEPTPSLPAGIMIDGARSTLIVGGTITGFTGGITVSNSTVTQVRDIVINDTFTDGIRLADSRGIQLENVHVTGSGPGAWAARGIVASHVTGLSADSIHVSQWPDNGVLIELSADISMVSSSILNNLGAGITMWQVDGRIELDRVASTQNWDGIVIAHTSSTGSVTVSHSTTNDNGGFGLYTINANNARVINHTAASNGSEGIWLTSGTDAVYNQMIPFTATVQGSTASGNALGGISMSGVGRWTLTDNNADSNGNSGFGFFGGTSTLSGNMSTRNAHHGFAWNWDSSGTSTGDVAEANTKHGVLVDTRSKDKVTLTNMTSTNNQLMGLQSSSGIAFVDGGYYSSNKLDGIQAGAGDLFVKGVTAIKNGRNGIAFLESAAGAVDHVTSNKNGRYGICISKRAYPSYRFVFDVPPHELLSNGVAPRGTQCTEIFLVRPTPGF